jgi:YihY family inner membrane protein
MTSLVAVQGVIAIVGIAAYIGGSGFSDVVVATVQRALPGPAGAVITAAVQQAHTNGAAHRWVPVVVGTIGSLVTATTAFGQIERGLNRLYGVEQDRPSVQKYGRAFILALTSGTLTSLAFVCLALGRNMFRTVSTHTWSTMWNFGCWPLGLALIAAAVTLLFHACPRRCQPQLSWLAFGTAVAIVLWVAVTAGLGVFFRLSRSFGQTYGALAGMVALLLWTLLSSMSLLFGAAVGAQLEAVREGEPAPQDPEKVAASEPAPSGELAAAGSAR